MDSKSQIEEKETDFLISTTEARRMDNNHQNTRGEVSEIRKKFFMPLRLGDKIMIPNTS
jgi:hypothetical protein